MAKVKDFKNWNIENSIPRQILGQETYSCNQIWYKLIFKAHYYVFYTFKLLFHSLKMKKSLWLNHTIFKTNFYVYCATFWVEKNGRDYNPKSFIFDSNINNFDTKCPFRAFFLRVEISEWVASDSTDNFRSGNMPLDILEFILKAMQNSKVCNVESRWDSFLELCSAFQLILHSRMRL